MIWIYSVLTGFELVELSGFGIVVSLPVKQGRLGAMTMKLQVAVGLGARKKKMRQKLRMRECKIKKKETNCGWGVSPA